MNSIKIYNSLSKTYEEFKPINKDLVGIYSCGPTVYNNLTIGNLSAFIYADIIRRSIEINGYKVKHVMNITDIDDKTIRDSKIKFPEVDPMEALTKLTDMYTKVFLEDIKKTGIDTEKIEFISAVDSIGEMISLTQKLLDNKIAYIADDGVYFSITKYYQAGHKYGLLQKIDTQQSKSRVLNDEYDKTNASDFALWKKAEPGEPYFDAEFSEDSMVSKMPGRPGWHIECSAMSEKTLGVPLDIHTGGVDLKFPHHENEIAQTCGAGNEGLANYFVHNNHILVDGKKMSKSLGNFYTLRDLEEREYTPESFRMLILESHYHSESNFSWEILTAAQNRITNWKKYADLYWQLPNSEDESIIDSINKRLADDFNTPLALKDIDEYFEKVTSNGQSPSLNVLEHIKSALGLDLIAEDISPEIKKLIATRQEARNKKDWTLSDEIREELKQNNIEVRDELDNQIWSKIN
jgi:cysteinyl-tRNA synthetase